MKLKNGKICGCTECNQDHCSELCRQNWYVEKRRRKNRALRALAVPDGKYQVNVDRVELTRAQTSGNPMLKWTLRILAPTHKGRLLWRNNVMASNENIKWLKQDLYTCGLQLQKLSDLPGHLEQLLNIKLEVTKRTRGENENIYFNRRIVMADDAGAPGAAMDDMIPF